MFRSLWVWSMRTSNWFQSCVRVGDVTRLLDNAEPDRFHVRAHDDDERQAGVVVDAIVEIVVRVLPVAVHEQLGAGPQVVGPRAAHDRAAHAGACARDAGGESGQLDEVTSVERQILHLSFLDHAAEHGRLGFEQRCGPLDHDGLAAADRQSQVNLRPLIDLQLHTRPLDPAEAGRFGGERVGTGLQRREDVVALVPGRGRAADAGGLVGQRDRDTGHDAAGTIPDRADQVGGADLGDCHRRRKQQEKAEREKYRECLLPALHGLPPDRSLAFLRKWARAGPSTPMSHCGVAS